MSDHTPTAAEERARAEQDAADKAAFEASVAAQGAKAEPGVERGYAAPITTVTQVPQPPVAAPPPPALPIRTPEQRAEAAKKYEHSPEKQERDEVRFRFAPLRATIAHAANGDRAALASALTQLADLHQGPLDDDTAADHLREAGAALELGRAGDAEAALQAARSLLPAGPTTDKVAAAQDALAVGEEVAALKMIDEALAESGPHEPEHL